MSKVVPFALALFGLAVTPLVAQQAPTVALGTATATFADPFTQIGGVREVAPGKVILTDPRDKLVELLDLTSGSTTKIGREGSGPGEFEYPRTLLPLPDQGTLVVDPLQARFLRLDATGKVVETMSYPQGMGPGTTPLGADAQGRIYWEGSALGGAGQLAVNSGSAGEIHSVDSVPVIRWDRRNGRVDTLLLVKGPQLKVNLGGTAHAGVALGMLMASRPQPFASRDAWGVAPDGRVAVVRSGPYRVDVRTPGGERTNGPVVRTQALPFTAEDKAEYLKTQGSAPQMTRTFGGGGVAPAPSAPPSADEYDWPATKPFFDPASVWMSPQGELWSLPSRPAGDEVPVYDVFNSMGKLVRRVTFPAKTRLVGFGAGTIYVARTDEDDLQYLERYADCGTGCGGRGMPIGR